MHHLKKKGKKFFKKISKRLAPEMREILLLWFTSRHPVHGYQLMRDFEEIAPPELALKANRIYPGLEKMKAKGYLEAETDRQATKRPRKLYRLTPEGRTHLLEEIDRLSDTLASMRSDLSAIKAELTQDQEF